MNELIDFRETDTEMKSDRCGLNILTQSIYILLGPMSVEQREDPDLGIEVVEEGTRMFTLIIILIY